MPLNRNYSVLVWYIFGSGIWKQSLRWGFLISDLLKRCSQGEDTLSEGSGMWGREEVDQRCGFRGEAELSLISWGSSGGNEVQF